MKTVSSFALRLFQFEGTKLHPNVLLMCKLLVILMTTHHMFFKIDDPHIPFIPALDMLHDYPGVFNSVLRTIYACSVFALLFNIKVRTASIVTGIVATNHIPIMMLTAKAQLEDKLFGLQAGADAYLTKPFEKQELLVRVSQLIHKRKALQDRYSIKKIIELDKATLKDDKKVTFLDQVIKHIELHLDDTDYNSLQLAKHMHISESQLYRKLKALTNKSTALFIRYIKLEKAKQLSENTDLSISEVAYASGFSNPNWFSKAFKAEFNCNPTQIRN